MRFTHRSSLTPGWPAALACTLALSSAPASAQWTLPRGEVVVGVGADVGYADREFFGFADAPGQPVSPGARPFPLRGRYVGGGARLGIRAGFTDDLELELSVPIQFVSYRSDPVLLLPQPDDATESSLDYYQRNVIDLSQTTWGLADLGLAARYRWLANPLAIATEVRIKTPTGYRGPSGTFGDRPNSAEDFATNAGTYASPRNVQDDVTLGDGQADVTARLQIGAAFPTRTFVRGDVGYNLRLGDAGDQFVASLRAGQSIAGTVLLFAGASLAYTVEPGRVIGVSVAAVDPTLPADQYVGTANLLLREVRLQRDSVDVSGGVLVRLTPEVELTLSYSQTVWGRNTSEVHVVGLSLSARTHLAPPPPPPEPEPVPAPEVETGEDTAAPGDAPGPAATTDDAQE